MHTDLNGSPSLGTLPPPFRSVMQSEPAPSKWELKPTAASAPPSAAAWGYPVVGTSGPRDSIVILSSDDDEDDRPLSTRLSLRSGTKDEDVSLKAGSAGAGRSGGAEAASKRPAPASGRRKPLKGEEAVRLRHGDEEDDETDDSELLSEEEEEEDDGEDIGSDSSDDDDGDDYESASGDEGVQEEEDDGGRGDALPVWGSTRKRTPRHSKSVSL